MKNGFKRVSFRVLSTLLCLLILLSTMSVGFVFTASAEALFDHGDIFYLKPNSNWEVDNARFAMYIFYHDSNQNKDFNQTWLTMYQCKNGNEDYYWARIPLDSEDGEGVYYNRAIFCRMDPSKETNDWNYKWNQTGDLTAPSSTNTCFTVPSGAWDGSTSGWGTPPSTTIKFVNSDDWTNVKATAYYQDNACRVEASGNMSDVSGSYAPNQGQAYTYTFREPICNKVTFSGTDKNNQTAQYTDDITANQYFDRANKEWSSNLSSFEGNFELVVVNADGNNVIDPADFTTSGSCEIQTNESGYAYIKTVTSGSSCYVPFYYDHYCTSKCTHYENTALTLYRGSNTAENEKIFLPAGNHQFTMTSNTSTGTISVTHKTVSKTSELTSEFYLHGNFTDWESEGYDENTDGIHLEYIDSSTVQALVYLPKSENGSKNTFKICSDINGGSFDDGRWYTIKDRTIKYTDTTVDFISMETNKDEDANSSFYSSGGLYTFTYNVALNEIKIDKVTCPYSLKIGENEAKALKYISNNEASFDGSIFIGADDISSEYTVTNGDSNVFTDTTPEKVGYYTFKYNFIDNTAAFEEVDSPFTLNIGEDQSLKMEYVTENTVSARVFLAYADEAYKYNVEENNNYWNTSETISDNGTVALTSGAAETYSNLETTGGYYTFTFDTSTNALTVKKETSSYTLNIDSYNNLNMEYVSENVVSATVFLNSSNTAYDYNIKNGEEDFVSNNLEATGGIYTFILNTDTKDVTVEHSSDLTYYFAISDEDLVPDFDHLQAYVRFTDASKTSIKQPDLPMKNTFKTYKGKPIYAVSFPYSSCMEYITDLEFQQFNPYSWVKEHAYVENGSVATETVHNKMFVYDGTSVKMYNHITDSELPVPTFVLNGGKTTVTTREDLVFTLTCEDLPENTPVTLYYTTSNGEEATAVFNSNTVQLDKGTFKTDVHTVKVVAGNKDETATSEYSLTFTVDDGNLTADYYLVGNNIGNGIENIKYPMIENKDQSATGVYQILSIPYSNICGSGVNFRFTDGVNFYTPSVITALESDTTTNGRLGYKTKEAPKIGNPDNTYYTCAAPSNWNYVNLYWNTKTNEIWVTQVDNYGYDSLNVSVTLQPSDAEVEYDNSVTFTANVDGKFMVTTDGKKYDSYESNLTYKLYKMNSTAIYPEGDKLIDTVTTAQGKEVTFTDTIKNNGKYYVIVSPAANTNIRVASNVSTITAVDEVKEVSTDIYFDFSSLATVPSTATLKILNTKTNEFANVTLTKLDGSNTILTGKANLYYSVSTSSKVTSKSLMYTLTIGDTTMYFAESDQPNMSRVKDTNTIWYKSVGTTLNTASVQYDDYVIDETLTITEEDTPKLTLGSAKYETVRIYCTDSLGEYTVSTGNVIGIKYGTDKVNVDSATSYENMTFLYVNGYGEDVYYCDVPISTKYVGFKTIDKDGKSYTPPVVELKADIDYNTNNAYYFNDNGTAVKLWPNTLPESPIVISYYNSVAIDLDDTVDITPLSYFKTIKFGIKTGEDSNGNPIYTEATKSNPIETDYFTLQSDGKLTPKAITGSNIQEVYVIPYGGISEDEDECDTFEPSPIKITIVNKSELRTMIANAQKVIETQKATPRYTRDSYEAMLKVYNGYEENGDVIKGALEIFRNSFDQDEIDNVATKLKEAIGYDTFEGLVPLDYAEDSASSVDIISYKTAVIDVKASNGTIGEVTSNGGVVKNNDGSYSVTYAAKDNIADFTYNLTAKSSAIDSSRKFVQWSANNSKYEKNPGSELSIREPLTESTVFVAEYEDDNPIPVEIIYYYHDYVITEAEDYEYSEDNISEKLTEYVVPVSSVSASIFENADMTAISSLAEVHTPFILSQYCDYKFDKAASISFESVKDSEGEIISYKVKTILKNEMRGYTVSVEGKALRDENGEIKKFHFQEIITIDASDYTSESKIYWYNEEDENQNPISTSTKYQLRVTENMKLGIIAQDDTKIENSVVVTPAFAELDGNNQFHQNFFVQNFFDPDTDNDGEDDLEFVGGGVLYYIYNDAKKKPLDSAAKNVDDAKRLAFAEELAQAGKSVSGEDYNKSGYYYYHVDFNEDKNKEKEVDKLFRYATSNGAYNYFFDRYLTYGTNYANYSYHLYAYYVYKDADGKYQVVISNDYVEARCYLTKDQIANQ